MQINPVSQFLHTQRQSVDGSEEHGRHEPRSEHARHGQATAQLARSIATDRLFLNQMRPDQARQFVTDSVLASLFRNAGLEPVSMPEVSSNPQAAEQIADVAEAVSSPSDAAAAAQPAEATQNTGAPAPLSAVADTAMKQAEAAASTLEEGDAQPDVLTEIRDLLSQIRDRLDTRKSESRNHDHDHHGRHSNEVSGSRFNAGYRAIDSASNTSVEIRTADGDVVTIDIASRFQSESTRFGYRDGDTMMRGFERSMSRESSLEFHVEGDLDENELKAITQVMQKLNGVADKFYSGNMEEEIGKVLDLGVGMDEIAAVSMDLSYSMSVQNVKMYQQTRGGDEQAESAVSRIASMIREIAETYSFTAENTRLAEPAAALSSLLEGIIDAHPAAPEPNAAEEPETPALVELFKQLAPETNSEPTVVE